MLHIIGCTPIVPKKISEYTDEFLLVHLYSALKGPRQQPALCFDMYYPKNLTRARMSELLGNYGSDDEVHFDKYSVDSLSKAIDSLCETIQSSNDDMAIVVCAVHESWNNRLVKKVDKRLAKMRIDVKSQDIHRAFKMPSQSKVENYLRVTLGSEHIYQDDPVNWCYAVYQLYSGNSR